MNPALQLQLLQVMSTLLHTPDLSKDTKLVIDGIIHSLVKQIDTTVKHYSLEQSGIVL